MSHRDNAEERPNTASFRQWGFVGIGETKQEKPSLGTNKNIDDYNKNKHENTTNEDTTNTNSVHTMDIDLEEQSFPPEESNSRKRKRSRSAEELSAVKLSKSGMRDEEEIQEGEGEVSPRPLLKKYQDPGLTGNRPREKKPMLCIRNLRAMLVVTGPTMNPGVEVRGSTQRFQWQRRHPDPNNVRTGVGRRLSSLREKLPDSVLISNDVQ
jgi:hypothetical protein